MSGAPLRLEVPNATVGGACLDQRQDRTEENGDFHLCRHMHAMAGPVEVLVTLGDTTARAFVDPLLRRAYVAMRLDEPWPTVSIQGERAFARAYVVTGRIVDEHVEPVVVEAIRVNATPRAGTNVSVELVSAQGQILAHASTRTNEHGDYRAELSVPDVPDGARVRVRALDVQREASAPADVRRADIAVVREPPLGTAPMPGAGTGRIPLDALAPVAALAVAAALASAAAGRRGRR